MIMKRNNDWRKNLETCLSKLCLAFRKKRTEESVGVAIDLHVASDGRDVVETGEIRQLGVVPDRQVASDGRDAVETCESRQLVVAPDVQVASDTWTSPRRSLKIVAYTMENPNPAFPRYPELPSRISDNMESKDIIRLQRDLTTNALNLMGEGDKQIWDITSFPLVCTVRHLCTSPRRRQHHEAAGSVLGAGAGAWNQSINGGNGGENTLQRPGLRGGNNAVSRLVYMHSD